MVFNNSVDIVPVDIILSSGFLPVNFFLPFLSFISRVNFELAINRPVNGPSLTLFKISFLTYHELLQGQGYANESLAHS